MTLKEMLHREHIMQKKKRALKRINKLMDKRSELIAKYTALGAQLETEVRNYHEKFYGEH